MQPSGKLHLGNYFGAIRQHIALQDEGRVLLFHRRLSRPDHHPGATAAGAHRPSDKLKPRDFADTLRENTLDVALDYLALGLDPDKAVFFRQSDVPEVTELAWILRTVTNMGLLERAVSYKEKIDKGIEASVGLFTYPVLMAADILIYRSHMVPVGKDQVQHIEMTRDIAGKFNRAFGEVFPIPTYRLDKESKVPGIDGQKMSKSYGNTIDIFAEGKPLQKTVMGIVTDSTPVEAPKDPETMQRLRPVQPVRHGRGESGAGGALPGRRHRLRRGEEDAAGEDQRLLRPRPREAQATGGSPGRRRGGAEARGREGAGGGAQDDGAGARAVGMKPAPAG